MKKILLSLAILAMAFSANAQVNLEAEAGFNYSKMYNSTLKDGSDAVPGFHVGVRGTMDLPASGLYLNGGALLSMKGGEELGTARAGYLEIPVHIGYKVDIAPSTDVFCEVGPYAGLGLFGNIKYDGVSDVEPLFTGNDSLKRFDFGFGARAGVEFSKISVYIGYDYGLFNIADPDYKIYNDNKYVGVGFKF